jgi:Icc protein
MPARTIAHITDIHLGQKIPPLDNVSLEDLRYQRAPGEHKQNLKTILDDVAKRGITEIVFGGDIGWEDTNRQFFELIREQGLKLFMVLGNHDTFQEVSRYYDNSLIQGNRELYYAYEDEGLKYIYLDTSSNAMSDRQFSWLEQELRTNKPVLLFVHHPVLEINTTMDEVSPLREREKVRDLLQASGRVITMICGHYHMTDETQEGKIRQLLTPAASYQIGKDAAKLTADTTTFGYRLIYVDSEEISTEVVLFNTHE